MSSTLRPPPNAPGTSLPAPPEEPSPRERLARFGVLFRRALVHWKVTTLLFVIGLGAAFVVASMQRRTYASECTVAVSGGIRTNDRNEGGETVQKRAARLKDMLTERARLESTIKQFHLYASLVESKGMLDAVDAMRPHVGFRARESGRFVISYDLAEVDDGDTREIVQQVTQYLAESLAAEFATGNLIDLRREADFLSDQVGSAEKQLESTTRDVTVFLSLHPEYAVDLRPGGGSSLGVTATPIASAKRIPGGAKIDPAVAALYQSDAQLSALARERDRLEADMRASAPAPPAPAPQGNQSSAAQEAAAQTAVDAAVKKFSEAQADVLAKSSRLTADHPDMKAAQSVADVAANNLRDARARLAGIKAQQIGLDPGGGTNPYADGDPEQRAKLREITAQIVQREAALRSHAVAPVPPSSPSAAQSGSPPTDLSPQVALETEWQRLLRGMTQAKSTHDDVKRRSESAQLAVKAAQATAKEMLAVVEPAFRPTRPIRGGKTPVAIAGLVLALALAGLYAGARVALDDRLIDVGDIEAMDLIPVLGVIPRSTKTASATSTAPPVATGGAPRVG